MKTLNFNILQKFILIFCLSLFAVSCSTDSIEEQSIENIDHVNLEKSRLSEIDVVFVKKELKNGMISFVESVKPFYKNGMDFTSFKKALIGESKSSITREGDALLKKAYQYLSESVSTDDILKIESGKEIAEAFVFVGQYNIKNQSEDGDLVLFGNPTGERFDNGVSDFSKKKKCRWYQIGCHLSNVIDWLSDNGEELIAAITTIISIIALFD